MFIDCNGDNNVILSDGVTQVDYCFNKKEIIFFTKASLVTFIKKGDIKLILDFSVTDIIPTTLPIYKSTPITTLSTIKSGTLTTAIATTFSLRPTTTTLVRLDEAIQVKTDKPFYCGIRPNTTRPKKLLKIIGGSTSVKNSWPWQAFISDGRYGCGASLINREVL